MRMQKASVALHDNFIEDRSVRLNWHTNIDKYKNDAKLKKKKVAMKIRYLAGRLFPEHT